VQLVSIRVLIVVFVALSAGIALVQYNSSVIFIAQLMSISWGALAGAFLAPFLYGLYWKRTTTASVWTCFIFAVGLVCSNMVFGYIASPINAGAIAMVAGLVIVPLVSLITPKPDAGATKLLFKESYANLHDAPIDAE
jgi:Na+/proline symporter